MVCYKWVIKKNKEYYSLMNFGINTWAPKLNLNPYILNTLYTNPKDFLFRKRQPTQASFEIKGYHFWKTETNRFLECWNRFLDYHRNSPPINCILECEVESIIKEDNMRCIANKFVARKEIKI